MSTRVRAELSTKNKYWIPKHKYYELKHYCLQYPYWVKKYTSINLECPSNSITIMGNNLGDISDRTSDKAIELALYKSKMDMLENIAKKTDSYLWKYILVAVTEGVSYTYLKTKLNIPCCRDVYYELYRKFFWLLSKERE